MCSILEMFPIKELFKDIFKRLKTNKTFFSSHFLKIKILFYVSLVCYLITEKAFFFEDGEVSETFY